MKNIFVSSTFRDMQAERDLIQKEVLPQLRSKARKYGENINMIDLRWGVDTSNVVCCLSSWIAWKNVYLNLGNAYLYKGDEQKTFFYFEKVLEICLEQYQRKHDLRGLNHVLVGYNSVGTALSVFDRLEEAGQYFEKAIEIAEIIVEKRNDWLIRKDRCQKV